MKPNTRHWGETYRRSRWFYNSWWPVQHGYTTSDLCTTCIGKKGHISCSDRAYGFHVLILFGF